MQNYDKQNQTGNNQEREALLEAERLINSSKYDDRSASGDFQRSLKSKILEERHQPSFMKNPFKGLSFLLKPKLFTPALVLVLIIAVIFTTIHFLPGEPGAFQRLLISPVYAQDNFEVSPTASDSIGVESGTAFVIKSKQKMDAESLRQSLRLEPAIDFNLTAVSDFEFKLEPKQALQPNTVYNVIIAASFFTEKGLEMRRDYSWAYQVKNEFKVLHTLPRDKAAGVPVNSGIEITFSHQNFANYENSFSLTPIAKGRFEVHKRTLVFVPESLAPGTIYTVKLKGDVSLKGSDKKLGTDYQFQFETAPTSPAERNRSSFNFYEKIYTFSSSQVPAFKFYSYNGSPDLTYPLSIYAFTRDQQFFDALAAQNKYPSWARYSRQTSLINTSDLTPVLDINLKSQELSYTQYLVLPETLPKGVYLVQVKFNDNFYQSLLQVSDLAVYFSTADNFSLAWVNSTITKEPVAGANVSIVGTDYNRETNEQGLLEIDNKSLPQPENKSNSVTQYLKITKNTDLIYLPFESYQPKDEYFGSDNYWLYFYSDRLVYKPKDTIKLWGFVQDRAGKDLKEKLTVQLTNNHYFDYNNEQTPVVETSLELNPQDGFEGQLELQNVNAGYYSLELRLGKKVLSSRYVEIQNYVKPAYEIILKTPKETIMAGETAIVQVEAKFFDGTPVSSLDLEYTVNGKTGVLKTNETGQGEIKFPTTFDCLAGSYSCNYPTNLYFFVNPVGAEIAEIGSSTNIQVLAANVLAQVDFRQNQDQKTAVIKTKVQKVNLNKKNLTSQGGQYGYRSYLDGPAPSVKFKAKVYEISYTETETGTYYDFINKKTHKTYRYDQSEKVILEYESVTNDQGEHLQQIDILPKKQYRTELVAFDQQNRFHSVDAYMYVDGYSLGAVSFRYNDYYSLQFKNRRVNEFGDENSNLKLNEAVDLVFVRNQTEMLPVAAKNNYLYYNSKQGIQSYSVSNQPEYSFIFNQEHIPNVYVRGVWFDGLVFHENSGDGWSGGGKIIYFDYSTKKLDLKVIADKTEYEPGEKIKLTVNVTDDKGAGRKTNLNLNLVDEAYYQIAYDDVSPLASLYATVPSGINSTVITHEEVKLTSGAEGGGCFLAGTLIDLPDGSKKKIEDLAAGDLIQTYDNPLSKTKVSSKVLARFEHLVSEYYLINGTLKVTPEHRVFVNHGWQRIGQAKVGDWLLNNNREFVPIKSMEKISGVVKVYNLSVENTHTYFADGFYVHNDKGGARENFVDSALFFSAVTNAAGQAEISFELPDNITSWRITAQAVSPDLYAGHGISNVISTKPVFVLPTIAESYLLTDKPEITLRAFGRDLTAASQVNYTAKSESLGFTETSAKGAAFESIYLPLPQLKVGTHKIEMTATANGQADTVILPIEVVDSRLTEQAQKFFNLSDGQKIKVESQDPVQLIFSDNTQGQFYYRLKRLSWSNGDRVDQVLGKIISRDLLTTRFNEKYPAGKEADLKLYQLESGEITLLPYSDGELELTAKVVSLAPNYFDLAAVKNNFYSILKSKDSNTEEIALALYGLAAIKEPILLEVQNFSTIKDLTPKEKTLTALAAYEIGDKELARKLYLELVASFGEQLGDMARLNVGQDQDDVLAATSLAAVLAAGLNDPNHQPLFRYVENNQTKDILINLEEASYITKNIDQVVPGTSSVDVVYGKKAETLNLEKGQTKQLALTSDELKSLEFKNLKGDIGLTVNYSIPKSQITFTGSKDVSIHRQYLVGDLVTNNFKLNDIVKIEFTPEFKAKSIDGYYQITDYLPSGLSIITNPYSRNLSTKGCGLRYPHQISGQKVVFDVYRDLSGCSTSAYYYYARVTNPGQYAAEPMQIQSVRAANVKNYSQSDVIYITR